MPRLILSDTLFLIFPTFRQVLHVPSSGLMCVYGLRKPYVDHLAGEEWNSFPSVVRLV